ncbi:MAG: glycosyltransferase family 2 protein, partial [Planctomycetes bacterium]|nr:glycosyltransferase family 2 protein [Planctomycetota bacterium]
MSALIVPCYIKTSWDHGCLNRLLNSIRDQTVPFERVYFVDDASPRHYSIEPGFVDHIRLPSNGGPAKARNVGIEKALAAGIRHLLFTDHDCVLDKAWNEQMTRFLQTTAFGAVGGMTYPAGKAHIQSVSFDIDRLGRAFASYETGPGFTKRLVAETKYAGSSRALQMLQGGTSSNPLQRTVYQYETGAGCACGPTTSNRLTGISVTAESGGVIPGARLLGFTYAYDRVNLRIAEERGHEGGNGDVYVYDAADRMVEYRTGVSGPVTALEIAVANPANTRADFDRRAFLATLAAPNTTAYQFDSLGNRVAVDRAASPSVAQPSLAASTFSETYDLLAAGEGVGVPDANPPAAKFGGANEYQAVDGRAQSHDLAGNLISDGIFSFTYNFRGQVTSVTRLSDNVIVGEYRYDAFARRVAKVVRQSDPVETKMLHSS